MCSTCNEEKGSVRFFNSQDFSEIDQSDLDYSDDDNIKQFGSNMAVKVDETGYLRIFMTKVEMPEESEE